MKRQFGYLLRHYPLSLLCLALVWYLSLVVKVPHTPLDNVAFIDKWTHLVMYGGTCCVIWGEYLRCHERLQPWKLFLLAWLAPVLMGGLIELLQAHCTTNRSGEWLDFWADTLGVTLAAVLALMTHRRLRRRKSGKAPTL